MNTKLTISTLLYFIASSLFVGAEKAELIADLDANFGVEAERDGSVKSWRNRVENSKAQVFQINDLGKRAQKKGSGRPLLKKNNISKFLKKL